jgi:hypothetical protein
MLRVVSATSAPLRWKEARTTESQAGIAENYLMEVIEYGTRLV